MVCHVRLPREDEKKIMETVYIAGGCLWDVQHFFDKVLGVLATEAGRANGTTNTLDGSYDGYADIYKKKYVNRKL